MACKKIKKAARRTCTSRRTRVIPVVDPFTSSFKIVSFCVLNIFYILNVLGLHVDLIQIGSKPIFLRDLIAQGTSAGGAYNSRNSP